MPLFESYPVLLIPVVILIVEAWAALKRLVAEHRPEPATP